ncbi:hypothetical protein RintRC_6362 [Richelia intracellularis]|nr:hypothetical protein RintRC_6362 [Richelia intracellularis]
MEDVLEPPFNAGFPDTAGDEIVQPVMEFGKPFFDAFLAQTKATAAK